jgi:hypothetical protein
VTGEASPCGAELVAAEVVWRAMVAVRDNQDRDAPSDGCGVICERPSAERSVFSGAGREVADDS